jgi:hypothetical protein
VSSPETTAFFEYREANTPERTAETLSALLGEEITRERVMSYGRKKEPPKAWREALGLEAALEDAESGWSQGSGEPPSEEGRRAETPPRKPADAIIAKPPLSLTAQAKERIAALHVFAGASVASFADADGFEHDRGVGGGVAKLWTDRSEPIAEAWIAWAEEGNKFAQSFVRLMGTGGAGGTLALGYATLLGGTMYIMGTMPDNEATRVIYGRYAKYRTVVPADSSGQAKPAEPRRRRGAEAPGAAPAQDNGASPEGAADILGGPAFPFGP